MFKEIGWLFFDVGSTIMNEQTAYEHRIRDIADAANTTYAFEIALERSNCKPANSIMVGDRIDNDIVPAKQTTIWIRRDIWQYWNIKEEIEQPDLVINNLTELCDLLSSWGRSEKNRLRLLCEIIAIRINEIPFIFI